MLSLQIEDQKALMHSLLLEDVFDRFFLVRAQVVSFARFDVDGRCLEPDDETPDPFVRWLLIRPHIYSLIRGSKAPRSLQIVLRADPKAFSQLPQEGYAFFLNISYSHASGRMLITTGVSSSAFRPDRSPERQWEDTMRKFFAGNNLAAAELP